MNWLLYEHDIDSSTVNDCPGGTKMVGSAHTHGADMPGQYDSEIFSKYDRINANNRSLNAGGAVPNYLGTPSGTMRKIIPSAIPDSKRGKVVNLGSL